MNEISFESVVVKCFSLFEGYVSEIGKRRYKSKENIIGLTSSDKMFL